MRLWLLIVAMGVLTYLLRLSFFLIMDRVRNPERMQKVLRFVPAAVLTAIVAPAFFTHEGGIYLSLGNARLWAGLISGIVAWRSRNILLTIITGMGLLWLFEGFDGF